MVDYVNDVDHQLQFYTDCRGRFIGLTSVQVQLVHAVLGLAVRAKVVKSTNRGFFQACLTHFNVNV